MINLSCKRIKCNEVRSFVYAKAKNVKAEMYEDGCYVDDVGTWVAIDADTKLVPSWIIAPRGAGAARETIWPDTSPIAFGSPKMATKLI